MKLTEASFWDEYWDGAKLPYQVDFNFSFDRCLAQALKEHLPIVDGKVLEVGCAPGKWLAFMATEFSLAPCGIEYSDAGMNATVKNFELLGLDAAEIKSGDFFQINPELKYDVVMSFGFIEHFSDVDNVVKKHLDWLKPGGILILGIPNFSGLNGLIQSILDRDILDKHNLVIMNLDFFNQLEKKVNLEKIFVDYIGSFEPALAIPKKRIGNPIQFFVRCILFAARALRKIKLFDQVNSRFFSSYILAVYRKI